MARHSQIDIKLKFGFSVGNLSLWSVSQSYMTLSLVEEAQLTI